MTRRRIVLDTNVWLSAIIFGGTPRKVLTSVLEGKTVVFTSPAILLEIALKLKEKFFWSEEKVVKTIKAISNLAIVVNPKKKLRVVKKDRADNKILEAALATEVEFIVTGDHHLLELIKFKKIKIVTAADFYNKISKSIKERYKTP